MPSYEPTSLMGLVGVLIVVLGGIGIAALQMWFSRRDHKSQNKMLGDEFGDVKARFDKIDERFDKVDRDIGGVREELRTERLERIAGDQRAEPFR